MTSWAALGSSRRRGATPQDLRQKVVPQRGSAIQYVPTVRFWLLFVTAGHHLVGEYFPYVFKGTLTRAGPGWPPLLGKRRARMTLTRARRSSRRSPGGLPGERSALGPLAALRPSGPRRHRRAS